MLALSLARAGVAGPDDARRAARTLALAAFFVDVGVRVDLRIVAAAVRARGGPPFVLGSASRPVPMAGGGARSLAPRRGGSRCSRALRGGRGELRVALERAAQRRGGRGRRKASTSQPEADP